MEIGSPDWRQVIRDGGEKLGVRVTQSQMELLAAHAAELLRWNRKTNLTAITDSEELAVKHILDSLAVLSELPLNARLLDIGSGGGFPGLVVKILRPDLSVTLIDAVRKKAGFLSHTIRMLGLSGVSALHVRAETLATEAQHQREFDVIVCRALCDLYTFVGMALPLLAPGGKLIAYKGRRSEIETELARFSSPPTQPPSITVFFADQPFSFCLSPYFLSRVQSERNLVVFRPDGTLL